MSISSMISGAMGRYCECVMEENIENLIVCYPISLAVNENVKRVIVSCC